MTYMERTFMGLDSHEPRERLGAFLRRQYRDEHKTKRLAADIDCTPKAAENMLADHWPSSRHFGALVRRFGRDVLDAVFGPDIDATTARLQGEIRELEEALERKRAAAVQAQGVAARLEALRARPQSREG